MQPRAWTALEPGTTMDAVFAIDTAGELHRLPSRRGAVRGAGAEHGLRRRRRQHRLPVARQDPDPHRGRRPLSGTGLGLGVRLEVLHPVRPAAVRAEPAGRLHRHRQSGGHRPGDLPAVPDRRLVVRLSQPAHHGHDQARRPAAAGRSPPPTWRRCSSTTTTPSPQQITPTLLGEQVSGAAAKAQALLATWDFSQPTELGGRGLLQRGLARPGPEDLRRVAEGPPAGRRTTGGSWSWST